MPQPEGIAQLWNFSVLGHLEERSRRSGVGEDFHAAGPGAPRLPPEVGNDTPRGRRRRGLPTSSSMPRRVT